MELKAFELPKVLFCLHAGPFGSKAKAVSSALRSTLIFSPWRGGVGTTPRQTLLQILISSPFRSEGPPVTPKIHLLSRSRLLSPSPPPLRGPAALSPASPFLRHPRLPVTPRVPKLKTEYVSLIKLKITNAPHENVFYQFNLQAPGAERKWAEEEDPPTPQDRSMPTRSAVGRCHLVPLGQHSPGSAGLLLGPGGDLLQMAWCPQTGGAHGVTSGPGP